MIVRIISTTLVCTASCKFFNLSFEDMFKHELIRIDFVCLLEQTLARNWVVGCISDFRQGYL